MRDWSSDVFRSGPAAFCSAREGERGLEYPSEDGGREELREFCPTRASRSSIRPISAPIRASRSATATSNCSTVGSAGTGHNDGNSGFDIRHLPAGEERGQDNTTIIALIQRTSRSHAEGDLSSYKNNYNSSYIHSYSVIGTDPTDYSSRGGSLNSSPFLPS